MSDKRKKTSNITDTICGSMAYDMETLAREQEREEAKRAAENAKRAKELEERRRREAEEARIARQNRQRRAEQAAQAAPAVRAKGKVSPLIVTGVAVLSCMVMLLLGSYIQVAQASAGVAQQEQELYELEREHVALVTKYEETFDMSTIKKAAGDSGMSKPSAGQVEYIELGGPDTAVVYDNNRLSLLERAWNSVEKGVEIVLEYFR